MSSCAALGNMVICSMNGSLHAALRSTNQSPACGEHARDLPALRIDLDHAGEVDLQALDHGRPFALSSTRTALTQRCASRCRRARIERGDQVQESRGSGIALALRWPELEELEREVGGLSTSDIHTMKCEQCSFKEDKFVPPKPAK
jgi:hypothetical protein